jgi:small subunit ribosomal protein S7
MSRRIVAKKPVVAPDPIFRSRLASMMILRLQRDGKKSLASRLFYEALESVNNSVNQNNQNTQQISRAGLQTPVSSDNDEEESQTQNQMKIFQQAVQNVVPAVEVKSRRVGGANYQVPLEVSPERGTALALRWIVNAARNRPGRQMASKLAAEILDASNKTGGAIRKREETHKMAEANKAFATSRFSPSR